MKFTTKENSGVTVITQEGNVLGGPDATELNNTLHELIDAKKKKVVVDLKAVSSMNSSGLGMLIGGVTAMRKTPARRPASAMKTPATARIAPGMAGASWPLIAAVPSSVSPAKHSTAPATPMP